MMVSGHSTPEELRGSLPAVSWSLLLLGVVGVSWIGLGLAIARRFSLLWLVPLSTAWLAGAAWWLVRTGTALRSQGVGAFLVVALLASPLYFRPHEYISGWDPGVYFSAGSRLARNGSLVFRDSVWTELSPDERALFSDRQDGRFEGFPDGSVPNFLPLYPVWLALFTLMGGQTAGLWVNPLLGLLAAVLLFQVAACVTRSPAIAWFSGLLLLLNVNHVYFARFSTAEIVAAVILLIGALLALCGLEARSGFCLAVAGLALPLAALAKIDVFALLLCLPVWLVWTELGGADRPARFAAGSFFVGVALVLAYYQWVASRYVTARYGGVARWVVPGLFAGAALAWLLTLWALPASRKGRLSHVLRRLAPPVSARVAPLLFVFLSLLVLVPAYWARAGAQPHAWGRWRIFVWILTPLGVALLVAGLVLWLRSATPSAGVRYGTAAVFLLATTVTLADPGWGWDPLHFWISRRLEIFVLPVGCFLVGVTLAHVWRIPSGGKIVATGLLVVTVVVPLRAASAWLLRGDEAGLLQYTRQLAGRFAPLDVVICHQGWLGAPLHYVWGVESFALGIDRDGAAALQRVDRWRETGRRVFYVTTGSPVYTPTHRFALRAEDEIRLVRLERLSGRMPRALEERALTVRVYEILPHDGRSVGPDKAWIATGNTVFGLSGDFAPPRYVSHLDRTEGGYRWTGPRATIDVPAPAFPVRSIEIRMGHARPASVRDPRVQLSIDGRGVGEVTVASGQAHRGEFPAYAFAVPPGRLTARTLRLVLESDTWTPLATGQSRDTRSLGVMVGGLRVVGDRTVDVGISDDSLRLAGFYQLEGGAPKRVFARWSTGRAVVFVPLPARGEPPYQGVVRVSSGRRDGADPVLVRLFLDERPLGRWPVDNSFQTLRFVLPPLPDDAPYRPVGRLVIESTEWNPGEDAAGSPATLLVHGVLLERRR